MQPILEAIHDGDLNRVKEIVRAYPSAVNAPGNEGNASPLMTAIHDTDRQFEIVEFLVEHGANVNYATREGYTPLHANIDVNGPSGTGEMPYRIARLLAQHGADVEARNHYGWTPLMRAALEGTADEFNALLAIGATYDVEYTGQSLPAFTRGKPLAWVVLPWPPKIQSLVAAGFRPTSALLDQARAALAQADDPQSIYSRGVRESMRIIEAALDAPR